jgi:SAM-dependent methyltransferase
VPSNREIYGRDTDSYREFSLMPAERQLLLELRAKWPEVRMLDLGIGTGRTTYTFSAVAGDYVGIDYSPEMVEDAKQRLGADGDHSRLLVGDARDLSNVDGSFGVILFSYNGIDSVDHDDRLTVLRQIREKIEPEGLFLFSSHSMNALPLALRPQQQPGRSLARRAYTWLRHLRRARRLRQVNGELDLAAAQERGWVTLKDGAHDFELEVYYVDPSHQIEQIREAGFDLIAMYDREGREVEIDFGGNDPWLHYLCRPC